MEVAYNRKNGCICHTSCDFGRLPELCLQSYLVSLTWCACSTANYSTKDLLFKKLRCGLVLPANVQLLQVVNHILRRWCSLEHRCTRSTGRVCCILSLLSRSPETCKCATGAAVFCGSSFGTRRDQSSPGLKQILTRSQHAGLHQQRRRPTRAAAVGIKAQDSKIIHCMCSFNATNTQASAQHICVQ